MGEHAVYRIEDERTAQSFVQALLVDIRALETMIERGLMETGARRVGVEQEMYLVDPQGFARPMALEMMQRLSDPRFQTEVALFNLEANLGPQGLGGSFLSDMERELNDVLGAAQAAAAELGGRVLLTGTLPTLRRSDVTIANLTPEVRYACLNEASLNSHGGHLDLVIDGIERFESSFQSVVVEGANTSIQLHLQVDPADSGRLYNLAQLITAPLLAAATNSPLLLGRRLWQETRVAVFERALDDRSIAELSRGVPTRVGFGSSWVEGTLVELFQENAARYQPIMTRDLSEDPMAVLARGAIPNLDALQLHNGTVWRWNRPCYGLTGGLPHLRIENRALPGGPSVLDETANAALFYGLMIALDEHYGPVAERLAFRDAHDNFLASAHQGLDAHYCWLDGRPIDARSLLLAELIPAAAEGLAAVQTSAADVTRYLEVIEQRVRRGRTGASWLLRALDGEPENRREDLCAAAAQFMLAQQAAGIPVHAWPDLDTAEIADISAGRSLTLGDIMTRDVFTVRPDDVIDLAASVMSWKHIRHVPVEDQDGNLVGLLSTRNLVAVNAAGGSPGEPVPVRDLMGRHPATASPGDDVSEGVRRLLAADEGCLLIVQGKQLVGIVTERDLLKALAKA
jgi:CBS domain-containing protein/gamma-glutamyl:cysteine ligase YbdK (ATP-grasp superfamily)